MVNNCINVVVISLDIVVCFGAYEKSLKLVSDSHDSSGGIIAIIDDLDYETFIYANGFPLRYENLSFRNFDVFLSNDWNKNNTVISELIWKDYDDAYFGSLEEPIFRFTFYDPLSALLTETKHYVPSVINVVKHIAEFLAILATLTIFYFVYNLIKNDFSKIGILKSLGLSNARITLIYALQSFFLFILALGTSIPISFIFIKIINNDFLESLSSVLSIFNFEFIGFIISMLLGLGVHIVGVIIPLIKLIRKQPIELIRSKN